MKVGILGAGQLGRMLSQAGQALGMTFRFLDPATEISAEGLGEHIQADYDDSDARRRFVDGLDVITWEFENVSLDSVRWMAGRCPVHPPADSLRIAGDRLHEKTFFVDHDVPVPPFRAVNTLADLEAAVEEVGLPMVVKTRRFGYDGKGQVVVRGREDLAKAWEGLGGVPLLAESLVPFDREISIVAARSRNGECIFYPPVENHHRGGILRLSVAPRGEISEAVAELARKHARRILEAMDYVGVLAIEFFQVDETLQANEMAPRVHNSGHWTIDGCDASQFENHLRAVAGMELRPPDVRGHCAMVNLIGDTEKAEALPPREGRFLHLYNKAPRPGRKVGHINLVAATARELEQLLDDTSRGLDSSSLNGIISRLKIRPGSSQS
ncbi:MAG: 5-(carboxyamino)imidazole ribonucleotide synthase [Candidatus Sumerlaeia bacterium]|nr:5-(carboxyamino)imidazole ribonucleotide synthase [Candidatus Sumerlaeia bacterium]